MGFSLQSLKKPDIKSEIIKTVKHELSGLEIELIVKHDPAFSSAFAKVQSLLEQKKVTKDDLKRASQTDITGNEALLLVIGEYCIKSWNVDVNGEPLEPNGDNLLIVCENIPDDLVGFLTDLITTFGEMVQDFSKQVEDIKKKPSSTTSGKRKQLA